jgi:midasin
MELSNGRAVTFFELADKALNPKFTDDFFFQHGGLFVEICGRWIFSSDRYAKKIAAFGRLIPFAPHLCEHATRFLKSIPGAVFLGAFPSESSNGQKTTFAEPELRELLLGAFRLLSFDTLLFAQYVRPLELETLLHHPSIIIRHLATRVFCLYIHAADHVTQEMIKKAWDGEVLADWEGRVIDYRFLSLWEEKRYADLGSKVKANRLDQAIGVPQSLLHGLSPLSINVQGTLLPRLDGPPATDAPFEIIFTPSTESNLHSIACGLLGPKPLLLTGLAGSGKTLLIRHFAWQLNKLEKMVTLHLNEQSDAKLLVGMYTTGAKPGTFSWRPGVLTTAVKEGRWIFIEDLDRAPNEVISTLLPLIERGELLVPSRGETIRAARGFRIIATMRSTMNPRGEEIVPRQNMIGHRFWQTIPIRMPELDEFRDIIKAKYPSLRGHVKAIMRVYSGLLSLFSEAQFSAANGTSLRSLTPRDLLKWCDRIAALLENSTSFSSAQLDDIFMEALDCFAGSLRTEDAQASVMACVAEELHIDPQRRDHLLLNREIRFDVPTKGAASGHIRIGRARLARHKVSKKPSSRPFSVNDYTLRLLEKIAVAVDRREPLLLVGETGTGKTTSIQYVAEQLGRKLVAFNLSQQSESGDLLGGYKPVNVRSLVIPLKDEFDELFETTFSRKKNLRFLEMMGKRVAKGDWRRVCSLWREALKMVDAARKAHESQTSSPDADGGQPKKKRKVDSLPPHFPKARWEKFATDLQDLEAQLSGSSEAFAFSFLEGNIVKAVRNGDWVLLDEINLASPDTLEALADLLGGGPDGTPSLLLTETGNVERVVAHPNFRVFAAMNPATDVGKKDLPPGIRSRFTELYVDSPDSDVKSLRSIVEKYLGGDSHDPSIIKTAMDVTDLYVEIQRMAKSNMLVDGADQKAHFSLRTLTRTLSYAREMASLCTLRRALYEGFHMSFLTFLGKTSEDLVAPLIKEYLFRQKSSMKTELGRPLKRPDDSREYVQQGYYWLRRGQYPVEEQPHYIITPFVQRNMNNLIRASSTRRYPVLIQGPTSSGKTSMIEYLAKCSGNKFVRINNHEHTDLQEYLGSYISGPDGKLQFQEGILVRALREGHWIVLDELNLAPTDVLEALNRLLDDNRELLIPETQEVVRPHEDFMLFATQNPAGLYGGRKVLSRAFRNRFLELHFDDIPVDELTEILHRRTLIPESWCKRIVKVYEELSTLRQENRLFEQKSFATLRDLFRWALRKADSVQELASNGYMLLAERVRKEEERQAVKKILEKVMSKSGPRVQIDEATLFSAEGSPEIRLCHESCKSVANVVWTKAMRRLFVLIAHAVRNNEPVLLIGATGCGKTTVCQLLADTFGRQLHIVNAHQNTETGDLIGAQRPIRNRSGIEDLLRRQLVSVLQVTHPSSNDWDLPQLLQSYDQLDQPAREAISSDQHEDIRINRTKAAALFEWADGSLVHAMKTGQFFLLDEISLADDSVLERLNSVLEPQRTILLAEKGPVDSMVTASDGFQFLATMNPGGDYGKKELSPALRNRFTEIWVPALSDLEDILQIVRSKLNPEFSQYADAIVSFSQWFNDKYNTSVSSSISIRDTLAWVAFINDSPNPDPIFGIVHGAAMVFIDTLGANPAGLLAISPDTIEDERKACLNRLSDLLGTDTLPYYFGSIDIDISGSSLQLGPFLIPKYSEATEDATFSLEAPTTRSNAMRVARALQLAKPILLEGNPGVGKTTLVTAIARAVGKPLTRLNLSEQTDLMDLFGSDVPIEDGQAGTFAWRDAPFLKAMKNGDWVLLDEMNLASQSVLEGLNAVLDHRGEVYISELDQTFHKHPNFHVFAAQNPHHQGGGRKGLPASFVNRFTVVYADIFRPDDLALICTKIFKEVQTEDIDKLITFVAELDDQVVTRRAFGAQGSPWEFNLRDTLRWLSLVTTGATDQQIGQCARDFLDVVFLQRFRTQADRNRVLSLFSKLYDNIPRKTFYHNLGLEQFQVGLGILPRDPSLTRPALMPNLRVDQLGPLESLMISVQQNWPVILVGPAGSGKTSLINQLATYTGADIASFPMNADIDAMDLVGGYEQADPLRVANRFLVRLEDFIRRQISTTGPVHTSRHHLQILELLTMNRKVASEELFLEIYSLLEEMTKQDNSTSDAAELFDELAAMYRAPKAIDGARFKWVDGILVEALQQGKWLVLDNANLCSSSVLDRLNSLLEPNGYLAINEHATADGEARIVKPHPDFRIFLTMDPRYGELSRAMRNRAVEICLLTSSEQPGGSAASLGLPAYSLDSSVYRFRQFVQHFDNDCSEILNIKFDHLASADLGVLQSFCTENMRELHSPTRPHASAADSTLANGDMLHEQGGALQQEWDSRFLRLADFYLNGWISKVLDTKHDWAVPSKISGVKESQPFHPLANEPLLSSSELVYHQATRANFYDFLLDLNDMSHALKRVPSMKFERRREKVKLPAFLEAFFGALMACSGDSCFTSLTSTGDLPNLRPLQMLFWALLDQASTVGFDRATFQTYLSMLSDGLSSQTDAKYHSFPALRDFEKKLAVFGSFTSLTSGLSMERIWLRFKPTAPKSLEEHQTVLSLERLADRLDVTMWRSSLRIEDMARIRERFSSALALVRSTNVDGEELVTNLQTSVQDLEQGLVEEDDALSPFFQNQFEGLCQFIDLQDSDDPTLSIKNLRAFSSVFARRPTRDLAVHDGSTGSQVFARLYRYLGIGQGLTAQPALSGRFHSLLLQKLHGVDEVQLLQLHEIESEIQALGQGISLDTEKIVRNQYEVLQSYYCTLVGELVATQEDLLQTTSPMAIKSDAKISDKLRTTLEKALGPCLDHINSAQPLDAMTASQAWIDLALAGIALYVPDYPFDPTLKPMIGRKFFNEEKTRIQKQIDALRHFQRLFTGQETSLRIRHALQQLNDLGAEPPVPIILRPAVSELDALQGEFTNLLSVVSPLSKCSISVDQAAQDHTLQQNISHIIKRLVTGYRYYDDITDTVVGFLVCLNIGLTIAGQKNVGVNHLARLLSYISNHTPFNAFEVPTEISLNTALIQNCAEVLQIRNEAIDPRWHVLQSLSAIAQMNDHQSPDNSTRELTHNIFADLYGQWKEKLVEDQKKEAADHSLYTYRGEQDNLDADKEDPELFPDYEKEDSEDQSFKAFTTRDHAIRLSDIHEEIFIGGRSAQELVKRLVKWSSEELGRLSDGDSHGTTLDSALPAIFLALERKSDALLTAPTARSYNFYFDANLAEAKRFIALIHKIQHRYRQIRRAWPEHATLGDVLKTCDEALAFRHVDPVAKFITKAEKLHGYIYEWQKVASREFNTEAVYDELTKLLVSWRQLELTTWAKLFEIEMEKCRNDAKSWFFVAYETIIAAPESIEDEKMMKSYAKEVIKTLEGFFASTSLGQFQCRLRLLQQFRQHVAIRMQDIDSFRHIHLALDNFIAYISRFEKPVQEALAKGRLGLDKQINDIIKLASWKDTNIDALRQSAKASHRKLSKLVRKFRGVLNKPVSGIFGQGFTEAYGDKEVVMESVDHRVDVNAMELCNAHVPEWETRPARFRNLASSISIMRSKSTPDSERVDGTAYIENFVTELESTIAQLQKATPSILTEENKETVQHLKTRKHKLFADTLKELRQMGLTSNLSSKVLEKQDELSTVLASLPTVSHEECSGAEYFLHKALHVMPLVRGVAKEHSGDLTSSVVARSIGYMESLLHSTIRQRNVLNRAIHSLQEVQEPVIRMSNLWVPQNYHIRLCAKSTLDAAQDQRERLTWLSVMLEVAADIVTAQAKLGKLDLSVVTTNLKKWSVQCCDLFVNARLPALPENVGTDKHMALNEEISNLFVVVRDGTARLIQEHPILQPTLKQILPWTKLPQHTQLDDHQLKQSIPIQDARNSILELLDLMLGSMQDVETTLSGLPSSTEDAAWLVNEEQTLAAAISSLHASQISRALNRMMAHVHRVDLQSSDAGIYIVSALYASVFPIVQQYIASFKYIKGRYDALHTSTAKLLYRLAKPFLQIGSQGFCTPSEKSAEDKPGKDDKLESGTGLGEGEGAEDISKDIKEDEDLDDLAQEKDGEREGSIEQEDDAINMGEQDMEGEMGEDEEKGDEEGSDDEDADDAQSQVGSVDDLGPSAVDEKMWDDGAEEKDDAKEREADADVGTENKDEQVAAEDKEKKEQKPDSEDTEQQQEDEEDVDMDAEEQEENVGVGETEKIDPFAKEEETLDLPDELNVDGEEDGKDEEDEMMDDMEGDAGEELEKEEGTEPDTVASEIGEEDEAENPEDTTGHVEDDGETEELDDEGGDVEDDVVPLPENQAADESSESKDKDPMDSNAEAGAGIDANENAHRDQQDASASAANREDGTAGEESEQQQETSAEEGTTGQASRPDAGGRGEDAEESPETESFKKIGDALERWYNQNRQIHESSEKDETQVQQIDKEIDMGDADFEHLPDDETNPDTQALGTASEEQAKTLDQDMAMAVDDDKEKIPAAPEDKAEEEQRHDRDVEMADADQDAQLQAEAEAAEAEGDARPQTFVGEHKPLLHEDEMMDDALPAQEDFSDTSSVEDVEAQLSLTHLDTETVLPSPETARALWLHHESSTHSLSQILTEHLRLILAPTMATKLRGDFRTGKRLNLKRIIPYIASGYKRDKIWLRRSQPSKRAYQIMIALDDSKSMAESGASNLALKTLALITRSLAMLEVGEVSVVSFGDGVTVAHDFDKPFTSESGVSVFSKFGFQAKKTNVRGLVERSLELFAEARRKGGSAQEDLWQLMIVVSDGICDDHAEIQRLVRRAREERVMIVFVIVDSSAAAVVPVAFASYPSAAVVPPKDKKPETSILDLQSVEITEQGKVVRWRYMDRFPFRYYLVVRDVRELPGVLSAALRQWFAEVVESGA